MMLFRYLEREKALFKARESMRVLELGAGLGLAGIIAALQVSRYPPYHILMTRV
jgi:predicted nicotinamide N-methyase